MRTRKTLNKPLLRKLALKLRRLRHEEHYDQSVWAQKRSCGTAACIAGHAAVLLGWTLRPIPEGAFAEPGDACSRSRRQEAVRDVAAVGIGLSDKHWLFSATPSEDWPSPFDTRWRAFKTNGIDRPSRIAADLLDAIADGKVDI